MRPKDTSLGGPGKTFPETASEMVAGFRGGTDGRRGADLGIFCQRYWKPIYMYVRTAWAKSNEDAKDLTQAFFVWVMDREALQRFEPERGSFRKYLKVLLRRFVGHQEVALNRLKRGGAVRTLSLDGPLPPVPRDAEADPEKTLESAWVAELVNQAVERVRERARSADRALTFQVYEAFALGSEVERPSYSELEARFGLSEATVKRYIFTTRREIREEIRTELSRWTVSPQDLDEEWNSLFGR